MTTRKKVSPSTNGNGKVEWLGSYNHYLTTTEKTAIKKLETDDKNVLERMIALVDMGYKVSMAMESQERYYIVTAFANSKGHPNAGYSLSLRHDHLRIACNALWFVISDVYDGSQWANLGQSELGFNW